MTEEPHRDLNQQELDLLIRSCTTSFQRKSMARLITELQRLREEAGERERLAGQEPDYV